MRMWMRMDIKDKNKKRTEYWFVVPHRDSEYSMSERIGLIWYDEVISYWRWLAQGEGGRATTKEIAESAAEESLKRRGIE